jgi:1-hydroxycarotenoid 3,4-desaturase
MDNPFVKKCGQSIIPCQQRPEGRVRRSEGEVVVIGAGMGGLAAAIRLAAAGLPVALLDRHPWPGGKMRTVESAAGPVDAGPTVLTLRAAFDELFAAAGARLEDHLTLVREPLIARHYWPDGASLDLFDDPAQSAEAVGAFAGARAAAEFRAFAADTARLFAAFEAPMMQAPRPSAAAAAGAALAHPGLIPALLPGRTLARWLAARFSDPRLAQLFGRYATYVGGSPFAAPAVLALVWQAEARGVWRVAGGMHRLAGALAALAERTGVRMRLGTGAARIETAGGRAAAVITDAGERLPALAVVYAGDPRALALGLLGPQAAGAVRPPAHVPRSLSAHVWSFAARVTGVPLAHHTVFFAADPRAEFDDLARGRAPRDPTLYLCAEDRGTGRPPPAGPERFEIILNAPPLSAGPPEDAETCRLRTFPRLARFGLTFDPWPEAAALTTPAGFAALFPGSDGSLYGRSPHGLLAPFARPTARSRVPGLYLAGGGVHPGAGIPMATLSGRHAAAAILADLASTSRFRPTATPGGISTASPTTGGARSR